jgi:hypothetical protein
MGLKSILIDYKNKKQAKKKEVSFKHELEQLKKHPPVEKSGLKSLLAEYKTHIAAKKLLDDELVQNEIAPETLMNKVIIPAFENLSREFEKYGEERKATVNSKASQASLIVFCNDHQEYIYRITIKNDKDNYKIFAVTYQINPDGEISDGYEECLFTEKKLNQVNEDDLKNDFYNRYRIYLLAGV